MSVKHREDSITAIRLREAQATKIAAEASLVDGNIVLDIGGRTVTDGTMVKFKAPCSCNAVSGGITIGDCTYTVVDAMGDVATGFGGTWDEGAQICVQLDCAENKAYIQTGRHVITLDEPPTENTVGYAGLHAIVGMKKVYVCLGVMESSTAKQYIWTRMNIVRSFENVITITENKTIDLSQYGLEAGDEIVVACVSGGCGGNKTVYSGNVQMRIDGGAAGKGGGARSAFMDGFQKCGGGGGAGGGYGAGGGGAAAGDGYSNTGTSSKGATGGAGGSCQYTTIVLANTKVAVTIGGAGAANGGIGGDTSFGNYLTVTGGGGSTGGTGGDGFRTGVWSTGGGGGGGGGGWYYSAGTVGLLQNAAGNPGGKGTGSTEDYYDEENEEYTTRFTSAAPGKGGDGGGVGAGKGGNPGQAGGDTVDGSGSGVVYIWY